MQLFAYWRTVLKEYISPVPHKFVDEKKNKLGRCLSTSTKKLLRVYINGEWREFEEVIEGAEH
jgi:hypothetical protein